LELDQRYCNVGGSTPQYVQRPRFDAFPESQRKARPTSRIGHSRLTNRLVKCLDIMQRPFDHSASSAALADVENALALSPRAQKGARLTRRSVVGSVDSRSSSSTAALGEAFSKSQESSEASSSETEPVQRPFRAAVSPRPATDPQRSKGRQDRPFYVSQRSDADDDEFGDELPDVGDLVSDKENRCAMPHSAEEVSPTKALTRQSRRRQRVIDESDEE